MSLALSTVNIITVNPCVIPESNPLKRDETRSKELQQSDYGDKYDYKTLCYDVFQREDKLILSGPPLLNLNNIISDANIEIDGIEISKDCIKTSQLNRIQRNIINLSSSNKVSHLKISNDSLIFDIPITQDNCSIFKDKRVLFSKSKNNKPEWIADWINYHIVNHSIDGVLLYDNNSTDYTINELAEYLKVNILKNVDIILIPWNFNWGLPGGSDKNLNKNIPWDSDFCQYGIMEHAKERFLSEAYGVLNLDIDELVITTKKTSIFDYLEKYNGVHIDGKWIENIPNNENGDIRFYNYFYFDKNDCKTTRKWCVSPKKIPNEHQWKIHNIANIKLKEDSSIFHAHFRPISLSWKYDRSKSLEFNPLNHRVCYELIRNLNKISIENPIEINKHPRLGILEKLTLNFNRIFRK